MPKVQMITIINGEEYKSLPVEGSVEELTDEMAELISNDLAYLTLDLQFGKKLILTRGMIGQAMFKIEKYLGN